MGTSANKMSCYNHLPGLPEHLSGQDTAGTNTNQNTKPKSPLTPTPILLITTHKPTSVIPKSNTLPLRTSYFEERDI